MSWTSRTWRPFSSSVGSSGRASSSMASSSPAPSAASPCDLRPAILAFRLLRRRSRLSSRALSSVTETSFQLWQGLIDTLRRKTCNGRVLVRQGGACRFDGGLNLPAVCALFFRLGYLALKLFEPLLAFVVPALKRTDFCMETAQDVLWPAHRRRAL